MGLVKKVSRYWHTVRHLRPVQFYGRLWFRYMRPQPDLRPAPALRAGRGRWQAPARRLVSMTAARSFVFLNEVGGLDDIGWDGAQREKLWRYNQHYFDDLNAIGAEERCAWHLALIEDWIAYNPPGQGNGWEPYPLSLRIVNWVKWALSGGPLSPAALQSLAVQARWLTKRLEIHLLGNHLFSNAKALLFVGLFFEGAEADGWRRTALDILAREIPEQLLPDGGQFELSTMYHAMALEDALDLLNVAACFAATGAADDCASTRAKLAPRLEAIRRWLHVMCHPDGEIALFNDAAIGIAPSVAELDAYFSRCLPDASALALKAVEHLAESGYVRLEAGEAVALLDVARLGPAYLPGHAHADTLSFELSLFGQRFLVNGGTSCYGMSAERLRQRGTAAHNTVVVDGQDSSEVWGGFRVARRAYPQSLKVWEDEWGAHVRCGHNGYRWLPGRPRHIRQWSLRLDELVVCDEVAGDYREAVAHYRFHPDVTLALEPDKRRGLATLPSGDSIRWVIERGECELTSSSWHPHFGVSKPCSLLRVRLVERKARMRFMW